MSEWDKNEIYTQWQWQTLVNSKSTQINENKCIEWQKKNAGTAYTQSIKRGVNNKKHAPSKTSVSKAIFN